MRRFFFLTVLAGLLGGCQASGHKPTVCDGKQRRTANPYGSVLVEGSAPTAQGATPSAAQPCGGRP